MNNRHWSTDFIGVLAEEESAENKQTIFVNKQSIIQFQMRLISQPPDSFPNKRYITSFGTDLEKWGFEDVPYLSDEERKQLLREFLSDSLIVCTVERKLLPTHQEVYKAHNVRLIPKTESYDQNVFLFPIPIFSEESHSINYSEFLEKIQKRKFIGRINNISQEPNDTPPFVLWKHKENEFEVLGEFATHHYAYGGFCLTTRGGLHKTSFDKEWLYHSYIDQTNIPDVMFVVYETYQYLTGAVEAADLIEVEEELLEVIPVEKLDKPIKMRDIVTSEDRFLDYFMATTNELGLIYSDIDLYNFHTAMKASNLVILAGMSGTGKSQLVNAYSRALGLHPDQFTFISVRPSWTDDADLIGYADTLHMLYRPGDSGLVNTLKQAESEENKDKLFIICFDEMNLARVEHYFSQFLSILELESGRRELRLYNDELMNRLYNSAQYPPTILIKDNVLFVGTVNLDESTYHFSDKVLDRANVIQLEVLSFGHLRDIGEKKKIVHSRENVITHEMYNSFKNKDVPLHLSNEELEFFWEVHQELQKIHKYRGVGPRVIRQIDAYLKNLPYHPIFNRDKALDLQIVQRILTKVRGSEDQLQTLLGHYDKTTDSVHNSIFIDLLNKYARLSSFTETRKMLTYKARELKINGYCS